MAFIPNQSGLLLPQDVYARIVNVGANPPSGTVLANGDVNATRFLVAGTSLFARANTWTANQLLTKTRPEWQAKDLSSTTTGRFFQATDATMLADNLSFDGTNWNLDDVSKNGVMVDLTAGQFLIYTATAGANPRTLTQIMGLTLAGIASFPVQTEVERHRAANVSIATSGVAQTIDFDTSDVNDGDVTYSASTFTFPTAGKYIICASLPFAASATGVVGVLILKGATTIVETIVPNANLGPVVTAARGIKLAANDTIKVQALQTSGGALNVIGAAVTCISITKVG